MTQRPLFVMICGLSVLTAACDGERSVRITSSRSDDSRAHGVLRVIDALQCPQTMGSLTRKGSAHSGGLVCSYSGPKGAEVSLHLVRLQDEPVDDILKAFETRLSADMPHARASLRAGEAEAGVETVRAEADATAESTSVEAPGVRIHSRGDVANVHLPGLNIQTDGDKANIRIGGLNLRASDGSGNVDIRSGDDSVSIQAHEDSAEIRTSAGGDSVRASWILTDNQPSNDSWRLVAYEARGPRGGPIVVATVRSRDSRRGRVFEDARDLVTLNAGR